MDSLKLTINNKPHEVKTDPDRPLLDVLREDLSLTGTKYGCGEGACGACSVLLDGKRVFSCQIPVSRAAGRKVTTVEGLAPSDGQLHPLQQAFHEESAFQCGYCTPGMMIAGAALLARESKPTDDQILKSLDGNICRCGTYPRICNAIRRAATAATAEVSIERKG